MDFEALLLSKVLTEDCVNDALDQRLSTEYFEEYPDVWEYVLKSYQEHGSVPPVELVKERFPTVDIESTDTSLSLIIDELRKRWTHNVLAEGLKAQATFLKAKDPFAALEVMRETLVKADTETRSSRDVNIVEEPESRIKIYDDLVKDGGITGLKTPWACLDEVTQGFHEEDLIMVAGRAKTGKCHVFDTPVMCADTGRYFTIRDIVRDRRRVLTRGAYGRVYSVMPDAWLYTGKKECLTVKTSSGRSISQTPEHPVMTPDGWKRTDQLVPGDFIEVAGVVPEPLKGFSVSQEEAHLLAAILADGNLTRGHCGFTKSDPVIVGQVRTAVEYFRGDLIHRKNEPECQYHAVRRGSSGPNPIRDVLSKWGVEFVLSKDKVIPDRVFQYENASLAEFLGMFWSCDGSFPKRSSSGFDAQLCLASKQMVYQIQHLMLRFGIHGRIRKKIARCKEKEFPSWCFTVYANCLEQFKECIPIYGKKFERVVAFQSCTHPRSNAVPLTKAVVDTIRKVALSFSEEERIKRGRAFEKILGAKKWNKGYRYFFRHPTVSKRILSAFIIAFDAKELWHLLTNWWDKVEEVEDCGVQDVYDLTVNSTHCFIANDIVVHNTWSEVVLSCFHWSLGEVPLLFSREMSVEQMVRRIDAKNAQLPYQRFRAGQLTTVEYQRWLETVNAMKGSIPFWVSGDNDRASGVTGIASKIRRYRPKIVYIDGGYLIHDERGAKSHWERWSNVCWDLKRLAQREKIPIVLTHQFNLKGKGTEGTAETLKYGDVEMWFDLIIGMYQSEDLKTNKEMLFKVLRQREGVELEWVTEWDLDNMCFDSKATGVSDAGASDIPEGDDGDERVRY